MGNDLTGLPSAIFAEPPGYDSLHSGPQDVSAVRRTWPGRRFRRAK